MRSRPGLGTIAALLIALSICPAFFSNAHAAVYLKNSWVRFSGTAGETLSIGDVVCIKDSDGLVYKADANDSALRPAVGIVSKGGASNTVVGVTVIGIFGGYTSLSEGTNVYLSETAGGTTQSSPAYSQQVGLAVTGSAVYYNFRNYLDTSALTALGVLTGAAPLIFEGTTADEYETTVAVTDPTADRTIALPDRNGTVVLETRSVTAKTQADTPFSVTTAYAGQVLTNSGASGALVFNLPEASTWIGRQITFVVLAAQNLDVNPDDGDQILGLTNAAGDAIRNAVAGGTVTLAAVDAANIVVSSSYGTWSDVN